MPDYGSMGFVKFAQNINAIDAAITYLADLFKAAKIYAVDDKGDLVEDDELVARLQEPNHLQGTEEFLAEFYYYLTAAGWCYMYPYNEAIGFEKDLTDSELFTLNPDNCDFAKVGKNKFELLELGFKYNTPGDKQSFAKALSTENIIPFWDGPVDPLNPFKGHSRLSTLRDEAINTVLADKGKHNQIKRTGAMVISHKERSTDGFSDGLDEMIRKTKKGKPVTHKDEIERKLNAAGLAQGDNILVSSKELTGFSLGKDIAGIDFNKMKEPDIVVINNKIGVPPELMPLGGNNAKYENREAAQFQVLQNRIIPVANNVATALTKFYDRPNKLVFSYEHLPAYQFAKKQREDANNKIVERVEKLMNMGILTLEDAKQMLTNNGII